MSLTNYKIEELEKISVTTIEFVDNLLKSKALNGNDFLLPVKTSLPEIIISDEIKKSKYPLDSKEVSWEDFKGAMDFLFDVFKHESTRFSDFDKYDKDKWEIDKKHNFARLKDVFCLAGRMIEYDADTLKEKKELDGTLDIYKFINASMFCWGEFISDTPKIIIYRGSIKEAAQYFANSFEDDISLKDICDANKNEEIFILLTMVHQTIHYIHYLLCKDKWDQGGYTSTIIKESLARWFELNIKKNKLFDSWYGHYAFDVCLRNLENDTDFYPYIVFPYSGAKYIMKQGFSDKSQQCQHWYDILHASAKDGWETAMDILRQGMK